MQRVGRIKARARPGRRRAAPGRRALSLGAGFGDEVAVKLLQDLAEAFGGGVESAGPATALPQAAVDRIMSDEEEEIDAVANLF